jgi:hypothetical protein
MNDEGSEMSALARFDAVSSPPERLRAGQDGAARLTVYPPGSAGREQVEQFIHRVYKKSYGASVQSYAPVLLSLSDESGQIAAAAGYRIASTGPLFLESYLSQPIESLIHAHACVPRGRIAEVGHLSSEQSGAGRRLIKLIGLHLAGLGLQWVSSTLTQELQHVFVRLGIAPIALGAADPARLGPEAQCWGTYYEHHPVVVAGRIDLALNRLARRQGA